jgi:recombination protein RecT
MVQQPARRELSPAQQTKQMLDLRKDEFAAALAGRVNPEAFIRVAYATITKSPKLLEATPASLFFALLEAASLGLTPNGVLGEAYIVPFNNKVPGTKDKWEVQAQFIPGYRGLIKLARQSGVIRNIVARNVYKGDAFGVEYGLEETLIHKPDLDADQADDYLTHVYAVAHFTDGTMQFEVMTRKQVDGIRARSKSADKGPWVTDYAAMAIKTVIRRLVKYLPISDFDLTRAIEKDDEVLGADDIGQLVQATQRQIPTQTERVLAKVSPLSIAGGGSPDPADEVGQQQPEGEQGQAEGTGEEQGELPQSTLIEQDGPVLDELETLFRETPLSGGDANARQRGELVKLGNQIYGERTSQAAGVKAISEDTNLGKEQVTQFISASNAVLKARKPAPAAETAKADPFGEG